MKNEKTLSQIIHPFEVFYEKLSLDLLSKFKKILLIILKIFRVK